MLIIIDSGVDEDDAGLGTRGWSVSLLEVLGSKMLWHVGWSVLVPGSWHGVLGLVLDFRWFLGIMLTLVVRIFVIFFPNAHLVSMSTTIVALSQIVGPLLELLVVLRMLLTFLLHAILHGHFDECLVLEFLVNICKQLFVLIASFSLVDFISDLGSLFSLLLGDLHLLLLFVQRANS